VVLFLVLSLLRIILGPSIWDRLLAMNLVATKVIILIIVLASYFELTYLLDIAIIYALLGFISSSFIALSTYNKIKEKGKENGYIG